MKKAEQQSICSRLKRVVLNISNVFSSIRLWFLLVAVAFAILEACDVFATRFTETDSWDKIYSVAFNLLVGGLISFLFYFLVVYVPERRKRRIIKSNLQKLYTEIKKSILYQIIFASQKGGRKDISADSDTIEHLLTVGGFKATFEGGRESDEGFYAFANHISDDVPEYREIVFNLKILVNQIEYVLHNYGIVDQHVFDFFKRLQLILMHMDHIGPGYDEAKELCRFIWEIFAGWSFIDGDRGYDIIEKMIGDI